MLGLGKKKSVAEYEARGEVERVYHEIKPTLRVSGVNLIFRTWASHAKFLPLMWDTVRPNLQTCRFEDAADQIRAEAARSAQTLGPLTARSQASLGDSEAYQIRAALNLYHYVNPKLLVLPSAVKLSLEGETIGSDSSDAQPLIARGVPAKMYPMEMESENPDDVELQRLFGDIKETLSLPSINSDYRTLALWPHYLATVWGALKPIIQTDAYQHLVNSLREASRVQAQDLPFPIPLNRQAVTDAGEDVDAVVEVTERFEQLLPGLIINIALCKHDWCSNEELPRSPFPAATRQSHSRGANELA